MPLKIIITKMGEKEDVETTLEHLITLRCMPQDCWVSCLRLKRRGTWPGIAAINKYYSATSCRYQATPHSQSLIDRKCYNCQHLAKQCPNALYCEGVVSDGVVGKGCVVKQGVVSEGVW